MRQDIGRKGTAFVIFYLPPNDKLYFAMNLTKKLFAILLIIVLSSIFRLVLINQSFWLDEAAQALESMRPLAEQLNISGDFQPPLFHIVVHIFARFNHSEWWLRMASVIPGIMTVFFTFKIGERLGKDKHHGFSIGLMSATLLALSSLHIYFSQELRPYSLAAMWGALSWYALLVWADHTHHNTHKVSSKIKILYLCSTVAGLYTMYVYPFLILSQLSYAVFFQRKIVKELAKIYIIVSLLFLLWIPSFSHQLQVGRDLRLQLPGWDQVVSPPQWKSLLLVMAKFIGGIKEINITPFDVAYYGIPSTLTMFLYLRAVKKAKHGHRMLILTPLVWLVISVCLAWLFSFIIPVLQPKRVLFALPAMYLMIGVGLRYLSIQKRLLLFTFFIAYQLFSVNLYWTRSMYQREDWRTSLITIHQMFGVSDTIVVFGFTGPFAPWDFYKDRLQLQYQTITFPTLLINEPSVLDQHMKRVVGFRRVLVFDYLRDLTDPNRNI
ncbi:MAG: hypothetical protein AAB612_01035, partial [Patescibacteria group bacterium]